MAEKPVSIPGTIKWQPGRIVGGDHTGAAYLYATNRYGAECCLGKWESPEDAKGTPYEREVAEAFAAADRAQFLKDSEVPDPSGPSSHQTGTHDAACAVQENATAAVLPEAHSGSPSGEWLPPSPTPDKFECLAECPPPFVDSDNHPWVWNHVWWRTGPRCSDCGELTSDDHCECDTDAMRFGPCWVDQEGTEIEARLIRRLAPLPAACNGTGRKTEESDVPNAVLQSGDVGRAEPSSEAAAVETVDARVAVPSERPQTVPASATIWAEVVDGLGRKVGAWFDERNGKPCVLMVDADDADSKWWWSPGNHDAWAGDHCLPDALGPDAAAQCRQLYERGMAEQEKTDRAARLAAQANGLCGECKTRRYDPKSNIAMCTECLAAVDFPGPEWRQGIREEAKDLAETKPRADEVCP